MIRRFIHLTCCVTIASLWGCSSPNDVLCTEIAVPAINVFVRDSASGSFAANGATATAVDGTYTDTNGFPEIITQPELAISLAYERAGTYAVTVTKTGYRDWMTSGVRVTRDVCHVRTVTLNAQLQH
jgi:hypothetical protein